MLTENVLVVNAVIVDLRCFAGCFERAIDADRWLVSSFRFIETSRKLSLSWSSFRFIGTSRKLSLSWSSFRFIGTSRKLLLSWSSFRFIETSRKL